MTQNYLALVDIEVQPTQLFTEIIHVASYGRGYGLNPEDNSVSVPAVEVLLHAVASSGKTSSHTV